MPPAHELEFIMKEFMNKVKGFFSKIGAAIKNAWSKVAPYLKKAYDVTLGFVFKYIKIGFCYLRNKWNAFKEWISVKTKTAQFKVIMDKVTTGLLIVLMCSPILILGYIFLWFVINIS